MISAAEVWLAFLALFAAIMLVRDLRAHPASAPEPDLRPIPAYDTIRGSMAIAAEEGLPIHLSLGTAGIADPFAMETVAALSTLDDGGIPNAFQALPVVARAAAETAALRRFRRD